MASNKKRSSLLRPPTQYNKPTSTLTTTLTSTLAPKPTKPIDEADSETKLKCPALPLGSHVCVSGVKQGLLKYFGKTNFADGEWCGVELFEPLGKNDGSLNGKIYFKCKPKHGIFAPRSKVSLLTVKADKIKSDDISDKSSFAGLALAASSSRPTTFHPPHVPSFRPKDSDIYRVKNIHHLAGSSSDTDEDCDESDKGFGFSYKPKTAVKPKTTRGFPIAESTPNICTFAVGSQRKMNFVVPSKFVTNLNDTYFVDHTKTQQAAESIQNQTFAVVDDKNLTFEVNTCAGTGVNSQPEPEPYPHVETMMPDLLTPSAVIDFKGSNDKYIPRTQALKSSDLDQSSDILNGSLLRCNFDFDDDSIHLLPAHLLESDLLADMDLDKSVTKQTNGVEAAQGIEISETTQKTTTRNQPNDADYDLLLAIQNMGFNDETYVIENDDAKNAPESEVIDVPVAEAMTSVSACSVYGEAVTAVSACSVYGEAMTSVSACSAYGQAVNGVDSGPMLNNDGDTKAPQVQTDYTADELSILHMSKVDSSLEKYVMKSRIVETAKMPNWDDIPDAREGAKGPDCDDKEIKSRPVSLVSTSSIDAGYNADMEDETENKLPRTLDQVSADVFHSYQKAVMKGTDNARMPQNYESDSDMVSDAGTIRAGSEVDSVSDTDTDRGVNHEEDRVVIQHLGDKYETNNNVMNGAGSDMSDQDVTPTIDSQIEVSLSPQKSEDSTKCGDDSNSIDSIVEHLGSDVRTFHQIDVQHKEMIVQEIQTTESTKTASEKKKKLDIGGNAKSTSPSSRLVSTRNTTPQPTKEDDKPKKIFKRTPPKSKWDNIMSQIGKESPKISPKEVKSKVASAKQPKSSVISKEGIASHETAIEPSKEAGGAIEKRTVNYKPLGMKKKAVIQAKSHPKLDYSSVKSKLETHNPRPSTPLKRDSPRRTGEMRSEKGTDSEDSRPDSPYSTKSSDSSQTGRRAVGVITRHERTVSRTSVSSDTPQVSNISRNVSSIHMDSPVFCKPLTPRVSLLKKQSSRSTYNNRAEPRKSSAGSSYNDSSVVSAAAKMAPRTSNRTNAPAIATSTPKNTGPSLDPRTRLKGSKTYMRSPGHLATGHQPDLVPSSGKSHAAQEIIRLEALCEERTKELNLLKMHLKEGNLGYEAMLVFAQYLVEQMDAFSCPSLKKELSSLKEEMSDFQSKMEKEIVSLTKRHETQLKEIEEKHKDKLEIVRQDLTKHKEEAIAKVTDQYSHEVNTLKSYHETDKWQMTRDYEEKVASMQYHYDSQMKDLNTKHDHFVKEIHAEQEQKLEEMQARFEEIKVTMSEKVEQLREECNETREHYEEALQRDTDYKVQAALAPYKLLPAEIESLKSVLELKNYETHDLRKQKFDVKAKEEELLKAKEKITNLEQKIENLDAIVSMKSEQEKYLSKQHQQLMRKYTKESKANKRLSMDKEELQWRLSQSDLSSPDLHGMSTSFGSNASLSTSRHFSRSPSNSEPSTPDHNRRHRSPIPFTADQMASISGDGVRVGEGEGGEMPVMVRRSHKTKRHSGSHMSDSEARMRWSGTFGKVPDNSLPLDPKQATL